MRAAKYSGLVLLLLVGCKALTKKHENPVLVPPPQRVSLDDSVANQADAMLAEGKVRLKDVATEVRQVSGEEEVDSAGEMEVFNATIVARVNGAPVFAGEVMERYGEVLRRAKEQLPPADFRKLRENIIKRDLRSHIERRLLVETMKNDLKPDHMKALEAHLNTLFEKEVERLKKELKVDTKPELEYELNKRGTSLVDVRESFGNNRMAMEYLGVKADKPQPIERKDLLAYYDAHQADYHIAAKAKWHQIQVSFLKNDRAAAEQKADAALAELHAGRTFADVARRYSDGSTAAEGGAWDWTRQGSLADEEVDRQLFTLPIGRTSPVVEGQRAYHILLVERREEARQTPFEDVQEEIRGKISAERGPDAKKLLDSLLAKAIIETDYDIGLKTGLPLATKPADTTPVDHDPAFN